jgi:hypothetical protein
MITCNRVSIVYNFGLAFVIDFAIYPIVDLPMFSPPPFVGIL